MKKLFLAILPLLLFSLISCSDEDKTEDAPFLNVSTEALNPTNDGGAYQFVLSTNQQWSLTIDKDWCKNNLAGKTNEPAADQSVILNIDKNIISSTREATVTIVAGGITKKIAINQGAGQPVIRSFTFTKAKNPQLEGDLTCTVSNNVISVVSSFVIEDKKLIPEFSIEGGKIYYQDSELISGTTKIDFSGAVELAIKETGGPDKSFTVNVVSFTGLPVVYIDTKGVPIDSKEVYVDATIRVIDNNGKRKSSILESAVTIKGRGNSTWIMPKKPYRLKFDKKTSLLGRPKDKSWVLLANYMDNTCGMRNATALAIGHLSKLDFTPTVYPVEVFMNGQHQGTYQLCEHMKISEDRVNVTDDGFLIESDQLDRLGPDDIYFRTARLLFNIKDPDVVEGDAKYNYIKDYLNTAENTLYADNFKDADNGYTKYLDMTSFVDWYVISEITKTNDASLYTSCYMNIAPNGKLKMGPIWDFDICIGNVQWNDPNERGPEGYWNTQSLWFNRMLQDPVFLKQVQERISYFRSNLSSVYALMDEQNEYTKWSVVKNNAIWKNISQTTSPNETVWTAYNAEVNHMKDWLTKRLAWLDTAFKTYK